MLLDDDIVTQRKAEPGPFTGRLRRKKRIEHLFPDFGRDAGAVVTDSNFDAVAEIPSSGGQGGLVIAAVRFGLALGCRVEAVGDQVEQRPA